MTKVTSADRSLSMKPLRSVDDFSSPWGEVDVLSLPVGDKDRYCVGFARSDYAVECALRLRYEVFNLELDEGLDTSTATGLDRDEYDAQMTHLILIELEGHAVVGTYRIQTAKQAAAGIGFYSSLEYDLSGMASRLDRALESGRACLATEHRSMRAIVGLWQGIGAYMNLYEQHYLFGCCSLTTQDPDDGWRALKTIREKGYLDDSVYLSALELHGCGDAARELDPGIGDAIPLPKLFRTYLHLGAKVISEPAIDRAFGTVDFLVIIDARDIKFSQLDIVK